MKLSLGRMVSANLVGLLVASLPAWALPFRVSGSCWRLEDDLQVQYRWSMIVEGDTPMTGALSETKMESSVSFRGAVQSMTLNEEEVTPGGNTSSVHIGRGWGDEDINFTFNYDGPWWELPFWRFTGYTHDDRWLNTISSLEDPSLEDILLSNGLTAPQRGHGPPLKYFGPFITKPGLHPSSEDEFSSVRWNLVPVAGRFTAAPASATPNPPTKLQWLVRKGANVTISEIGDVTDRTGITTGLGSIEVMTPPGTRYLLTATADGEPPESLELEIPPPLSISRITPTGPNSLEIAWTGGDGTNNIEGSTDGVTWTPLLSNVASPATVLFESDVPRTLLRVVEP